MDLPPRPLQRRRHRRPTWPGLPTPLRGGLPADGRAGRRRRRRGRGRPAERRHGLDGAQPRLARRAARRAPGRGARPRRPDRRSPTKPTSRPSPRCAAGPPVGVEDVVLHLGLGRRRWRADRRRAPLTGAAGYGGEVGHMPVNPDGLPCRCGSIGCWETEVGGAALLRRAGYPPEGGPDRQDAVLRQAEAGDPVGAGGLRRDRPLARHRAGRSHQHPQPAVDPARRPPGARASVRPLHASKPSSTGARCARPGGSCGSSRRRSAWMPRCSARPSSAFEPLLNDPAAWLRPRAMADLVSA